MTGPPFAPREIVLKDGRCVTLREAVEDDAAAQQDFFIAIAPTTEYICRTANEEERSVEDIAKYAGKQRDIPAALTLCAFDHEGRIAGIADIQGKKDRTRRQHAAGMGVMIHPDWQGVGLGRAMMEATLDWAEINPALEMLYLGVIDGNIPALRLYESLGFVECGRLPARHRISTGDMDEITMYKMVKP